MPADATVDRSSVVEFANVRPEVADFPSTMEALIAEPPPRPHRPRVVTGPGPVVTVRAGQPPRPQPDVDDHHRAVARRE